MNYWERWIGDWKRKTAHLSAEAKGIYSELLDHEYATHKPLPLDREDIYRLAGARTASECKSTDKVLAEFYTKTEAGYVNPRAQEEIAKRSAYVEAQRGRANARWKDHVNQETGEAPAPKRERVNGATFTPPEWVSAETWTAWVKIRPAKARTPASLAAAIEKLEKFRAAGHDGNAIIANSLANGWQGLFPPDQKRGAPVPAQSTRPSIKCSTCGERAFMWTGKQCDKCWRTSQGINV